MEILYVILMILGVLAVLAAFAAFALGIIVGVPELIAIALIPLVISIGCFFGRSQIETKNAIIETETVAMEVTKVDATEGGYVAVLDKQYVFEITTQEYAALGIGDMVNVKITTKTLFGETTETKDIV